MRAIALEDDDSENCQAVLSLAASTDYQYRLQR